ncbi:hypothetical protein HmCmsJML095_00973 [Escherichia coli]|nr:hypothetical protein HmCmsJML095_00973 [Escherichia coli]
MNAITKERIELFIKNPLENGLTRSEQMEVARIALASLEAEPDYIRYECCCCGWETIEDWRENDVCPKCNHKPMGTTALYTATPAPVVPEADPVAWTDEEELRDVRKYGFGEIFQCPPDKYADPRRVILLYREPPAPAVPAVLERLRAIVADPRALPRRKEWVSGQQYSYVLLENVEAMVDEACRAAMLKGDKS